MSMYTITPIISLYSKTQPSEFKASQLTDKHHHLITLDDENLTRPKELV